MIFYFSGTGNSKYIAQVLADYLNVELISIPETMMKETFIPNEGEVTGYVFPVFAWAPPKIVLDFIKRYKIKDPLYLFSICTCSEEAGNSMSIMNKALGGKLNSCFSIEMPNNYIIGADIDSEEIQKAKLLQARNQLVEIKKIIRECGNVNQVKKGSLFRIKSTLVNPLFNIFFRSTKPFYANNNCNSCKLCMNICPTQNIQVESKPIWSNNCTACYACYHYCPARAIEYGKHTATKGRYQNPYVK